MNNRLNIENRKSGKWIKNKSTNDCKELEVNNKYGFIRMAVNEETGLISIGDRLGSIYLIDISSQRFQQTVKLDSCLTCIAFVYDSDDINLIVSTTLENTIYCLKYSCESYCCEVIGKLSSVHKTCINYITISSHLMLSSSPYDRSCIWDLNTLTLLKQLTDLRSYQSVYLSIDRIITSYRNPDIVYVFDSDTFQLTQTLKDRQLISVQKNCFFTKNNANQSFEFNTICDENNLITKTIKPMKDLESNTIKQLFSCDNNRILIYLLNNGLLKSKYQEFDSSRYSAIIVSNELMTGITTVEDLHVFDLKPLNTNRLKKALVKKPEDVIEENDEVVRKLSLSLLSKYNKFPQKYRFFIWSKLLSLPWNRDSFKRVESQSNFYNKQLDQSLRQLLEKHDLIDGNLRNCLKKTISQLIYWKPNLLNYIEDLALFSFPLIKLFHKNQLLLFETLATLINNNYLIFNGSKGESELFELVSTLLKRESFKLESHFNTIQFKSNNYCLILIKSCFSEVFLRHDWLILLDHLMTFGPQFYVYLIVSYFHLSKQSLLRLKSCEQIENYLRSQNSMPVQKVIQYCHHLSNKYVSLNPFEIICLPKNVYN